MIVWRESDLDPINKEYGFFGPIKCFTLTRNPSDTGTGTLWVLMGYLPSADGLARGMHVRESRDDAVKVAEEVVQEFGRLWEMALAQQYNGVTFLPAPRESA
ncbi:hypothetical protein ACFY19_20600 [Streptosporangium saharense]|uniref:hypothetical protein n=1 Tax=Streptosporangium saharense TaxID=1706840 RepID=UPI0036BF57C4